MPKFSFLLVPLFFLLSACAPGGGSNNPDNNLDNSYIVVLKKTNVQEQASTLRANQSVSDKGVVKTMMMNLSKKHGLKQAEQLFSVVLDGGVYSLDERQLELVKKDSSVAYVEKNGLMYASDTQPNATWGLDRIDQPNLPLNGQYTYPTGGSAVNVYVIDTGITMNHSQFGGRASSGHDFIDNDNDATDCAGHGTHVSGTIGSSTYGVAKNVRLIGVRVLNCQGSGSFAGIIAGIEWVTANHQKPAVANMSLGGQASQSVDQAVANSIARGVTYALAAGNDNANACNGSPGRVSTAITVGSTTSNDSRSSFSNWGSCVAIFAPGSQITSTWLNNGTNTIDGTSMASPHVAGVAALYLSKNPSATPAQVKTALINGSTANKVSNPGSGSPNRLLSMAFLNDGIQPPEETPLTNNVAISNLSDSTAGEKVFTLDVPANGQNLVFNLSGGSGNADMYMKFGSKPTASVFDCRSVNANNTETCTVAAPSVGRYYVGVRAAAAYSGLSIKGSFTVRDNPGGGEPCTNCEKFTDSIFQVGVPRHPPTQQPYQVRAGVQNYWMKGAANSDFDIYLYVMGPQGWVQVAGSLGPTNEEHISYNGPAGTYSLVVISYIGTGPFTVWRKLP
jgi:serine protease